MEHPKDISSVRYTNCVCFFQRNGEHFGLVRLYRGDFTIIPLKMAKQHRPTVPVTLDPNTNHPLLVISDDGKEVRCTQTPQELDDHPKRFDQHCCVLGKVVLCGVRKKLVYYEVDVKGKTEWSLGLMDVAVSHKGNINFCSDQHLTIQLQNGHYWANTPQKLELVPRNTLERVGVVVHLWIGTVTFYDATSGDYLCSFEGIDINQRFYPMFNPGPFSEENSNPLIITQTNNIPC
ncbi:probable E3 ubiquitin-protein ligase TRIML1 [Engraulis encrasicolus]|uniref:probable E3 ubiquitin-protein ligase TRIML1 n=1 Tax=Engraulis encrasicolus TaxID=184585 RepID=UPI002FD1E511